jgi:hypothetical protein
MRGSGDVPSVDADTKSRDEAKRDLPPTAVRALEEARARRAPTPAPPRELDGRGGLDPVRYGDWEVKGLARDF